MRQKILIALLFIIPLYTYYLVSRPAILEETEFSSPDKMAKVVKFASSMCLDCQNMKKIFDKVYPEYSGQIFLIDIDIQKTDGKTKEMIKQYKVTTVPTTIFIDENSYEVRRIEGAIEAKDLNAYFKELIDE